MGDFVNPKSHLVSEAALPETGRFMKFVKPIWRKPDHRGFIDLAHSTPSSGSLTRSGSKLVVENIYKYRVHAVQAHSPHFSVATSDMSKLASSAGASPKPEESLLRAFSKTKSYVHPDEADESSVSPSRSTTISRRHRRRKSFSFFSSAAFSSLGKLCSVAGDDESSVSHGEERCRSDDHPINSTTRSTRSTRRSGSVSRRSPWFLLGCGSLIPSRHRRARHDSTSMDLKKTGLLQLEIITNTESECKDQAGLPLKNDSVAASNIRDPWNGDDSTVWSMDLTTYGEVVKCLVDDVKSSSSLGANQKSSTLCELFTETETDEAPMISPDSEEEFEDVDSAPPWSSSMSSMGSGREFWKTEKKNTLNFLECSKALVPYSGELSSVDIGNISDSQSLLRAKVFGAEMFRKHCQLERTREEETKKLLLSLDHALDQYNHERITEEESDSKCESPNYELFNSPVFESFLESSTKAWGTDSLPLRITEAGEFNIKTPGEPIRELHCVTVQSPNPMISSPMGPMISFEVKDITLRSSGNNVANTLQDIHQLNVNTLHQGSVGKVGSKSPKPPNSVLKKRSPSIIEDRIHHPQGEDNTVLMNFARLQIDELSSRKKRFVKPRRSGSGSGSGSHKQQQQQISTDLSKATTNGAESSSVSPRPPLPVGNVIKESVAVVVESSYDPYGDFRESMIDMIVDQNIQQTTELEELLQCYLALNEPDYHQVIIEVFSDVWHELFESKN